MTIRLGHHRASALGLAAALSLAAFAPGCAATATEMRRAEQSYDEARYEAAEVWLVDLEPRAPGMDGETRALYFYLRGMTEYRLGQRLRALHYLAVAREVAGERSAGLHPEPSRS